jgi:hypothetical protein
MRVQNEGLSVVGKAEDDDDADQANLGSVQEAKGGKSS